ncbi:MAG: hypothetical protein QM831_40225 [Kofleriaceae bacterium]
MFVDLVLVIGALVDELDDGLAEDGIEVPQAIEDHDRGVVFVRRRRERLHEHARRDLRATDAEEPQHVRGTLFVPELETAQARAEVLERLALAGRFFRDANERGQRTTLVLADRRELHHLRHWPGTITLPLCVERHRGGVRR